MNDVDIDTKEANDFGFSFENDTVEATEDLISTLQTQIDVLKDDNETLKNTNRELMKIVFKFLNNLKMEPEKPVIKWPNRVEDIDAFQKKLNDIYSNKETTK